MTTHAEPPDRLLDKIYDAATDASLWSEAVIDIADLTGSQGGVLFGFLREREAITFMHNGRLDDDAHATYRARHFRNPWATHMFRQRQGSIVFSDEIQPPHEFRKCAFYDEVLRPQGLLYNAMMPITVDGDFMGAFNILRSPRQGPFSELDRRFFGRLGPHLQRAQMLSLRLDGYRLLQRGEYAVLDRLACGMALLDRRGRVLYANRALQALTAEGALTLRNDVLSSHSAIHARQLGQLFHAVLRGEAGAAIGVPHPQDGRILMVLASSVRSRDFDRFAVLGMRDSAVMVFVFDPAAPMSASPEFLMGAYDLTLTEARVALLSARGQSVARVGGRLNISQNTVKTHLRRVFAKTGVHSQAELACVVASLRLVAEA